MDSVKAIREGAIIMFKIGEFSRLTQVSIRMLRYYDETGLLKPTEVDAFTNYRLYSVEQIATINKIKFLRDLGFSVSEIAVILTNWNDDYIASQLEKKRIEIQSVINSEEDRLLRIDSAMRDIHMDKITIKLQCLDQVIACLPSAFTKAGCFRLQRRRLIMERDGGIYR